MRLIKYPPFSIVIIGILAASVGLFGQRTITDSESIWASYVLNPDNHPHIPNNSYAGYHQGEVPLPEVPVVTDITLHGGVGDGVTDNSQAFRDAIEAAIHAGGGAINIPAGTWLVNDSIWIYQSGIVLRGAGEGLTTIKFGRPLLDIVGGLNPNSTNIWSWSGGLLWMSPRDEVTFVESAEGQHKIDGRNNGQGYQSSSNPWEYWRLNNVLANVTGEHERGETSLLVDDASALKAGMFILMTWDNNADQGLWEEIGEHESFVTWDDSNFGSWFEFDNFPRWLWTVEIEGVEGNTVHLAQPLRVATRGEYNVQIRYQEPEKDYIEESGVENLSILLDGDPEGSPYDAGWNGMYLNRTYNCWIKDVTVINGSNGFHVSASKNASLINTRVESSGWMHHPYTNRCMSHDILYDSFVIDITEDSRGGTHGINTEFFGTGSVWSRGVMNRGTFDTHRGMSFDMIRTDIQLRNEVNTNPGGSSKAGPYAGRRLVHWNVDVVGENRVGSDRGSFVNQVDLHTFGALVGIKGTPLNEQNAWTSQYCNVMPCGDKDVLIADQGLTPAITNLYDAQFAERKSREKWLHFSEGIPEIVDTDVPVLLEVSANAGGSSIERIRYFINEEEVGVLESAPYTMEWTPTSRGLYDLRVEMETSDGETTSNLKQKAVTVGERIFLNYNHPALTYKGSGWTPQSNGAYIKGGANYSTAGGASVQLIFRGTRLQLYSSGNSGQKVAFDVYLNGGAEPIASKSVRGQGGFRDLSWDSGLLEDAAHTIDIVSTTRLVVDGILIDTTSEELMLAAPVAQFDHNPKNGLPPLEVNFNASTSYDSDGTITQYQWDFGDGTTFTSPTPLATHAYTVEGEYTVQLTVLDNDGVVAQTTGEVFVGNLQPTASFTVTPTEGNPPMTVDVNGSASADSDGTIAVYRWDWNNDGIYDATGATSSTVYTTAGVKVIRLQVEDNLGGIGETTRQVTVNGLFAPSVLSEPMSVTVYEGFDAVFEPEMAGNPVPSYQWYENGEPMPGEVSANLSLLTVDLSMDGNQYYLEAVNSEGTVETQVAILTVEEAPEGLSGKVVDWGGNYVSSTKIWQRLTGGSSGSGVVGEFGDDGLNNDRVKTLPFSTTEEVNPVIGSDYDGKSARFFGGGEVWRVGAADSSISWRYAEVREAGDVDELYFSVTNGSDRRNYFNIYWDQSDFLTLSQSQVVFNESSRLYLNVRGGSGEFPKVRFLVRNGEQFYLSSAYQDGVGAFELTGETLRNTNWALYNPEENVQPVPGVTSVQSVQLQYLTPTVNLEDITAIGFFVERYGFPAGGNNGFAINDFEAFAAPAGSGGFNVSPEITLLSPVNGETVTEPGTFKLAAEATDSDGTIATVNFYVNDELVADLTSEPWEYSLSELTPGDYTIRAEAVDNIGAQASSETVTVTVAIPGYTVSTASWLGGSADDVIHGARIQSDGTLVLAGKIGRASYSGGTEYLIDGGTETSEGVIVRLSQDGQQVISVTRLPGIPRDLSLDGLDRIYVAVPDSGLYRLSATGSTVLLKRLNGQAVHRVDATTSGIFAGLVPSDASNLDSISGAVVVSLYDATGTLLSESGGPTQHTLDLCIDEASETLVTIGWRQTSASAGDNGNVLPVQIAGMRGRGFDGQEKWTNYNWASGSYDPENPQHINYLTNNMADSRGLLCTIGDDGKLYGGFEVAGGNHILRWAGDDLSEAISIVGGDMWHDFYLTTSEHKAVFLRYEAGTGEVLLGQQFATRYWDGNQDRGNAARLTGGDIFVDGSGRIYVAGASASGLPMSPTHGFSENANQISFNPLPDSVYTGGAFLLVMDADFEVRRFVTRLSGGEARAVHARILEGENNHAILMAGQAKSTNVNWNGIGDQVGGEEAAENRLLLYTHRAFQPTLGGGESDGFFALVEATDPSAPAVQIAPESLTVEAGTQVVFEVRGSAVPAPKYQWKKDGVPIPFEIASALSFVAAESDNGASYTVELSNSYGSIETVGAVLTIGSPSNGFDDYIQLHFGAESDELIVGAVADPDGDGLSNLVEYLLGLDPMAADSDGQLQVSQANGSLSLEFTALKELGGVTYRVTWSTDLTEWFDTEAVTIETIEDLGEVERMRASIDIEQTGSRFLRLEVVLP